MQNNVGQNIAKPEAVYTDDIFLSKIEKLNASLTDYFSDKIIIDERLTRKLVSFQANKSRSYYRWYKYKEAFSADLVEYLFNNYNRHFRK